MTLVTASRPRRFRAAALLGVLALSPALVAAQEVEEPPEADPKLAEATLDRVATALKEGDCDALLDLAAGRIEIVLLGQSALYSRGQAAFVLRDFFRRYPPEQVALSDRSTSSAGRAAMGRYWSASSSGPFTIYLGFRVTDDEALLLEAIRIDRGPFQRTGGY